MMELGGKREVTDYSEHTNGNTFKDVKFTEEMGAHSTKNMSLVESELNIIVQKKRNTSMARQDYDSYNFLKNMQIQDFEKVLNNGNKNNDFNTGDEPKRVISKMS
jgi:hypothetical protein